MLKRLLNECVLTLELSVKGRLMVKESLEETKGGVREQTDEFQVAQPVRTKRYDGTESIYLPGASFKGALRAQAERIARTLNTHNAGACDPFTVIPRDGSQPPTDLACSERMNVREQYNKQLKKVGTGQQELSVSQRYGDVCPICRTFGHLAWGKRLRIADFYPITDPSPLKMTHISVDRVAGGVATPYLGGNKNGSGRTFSLQYVYSAHLKGQIVLENFELWQLGLLGFLWQDMADGFLPVGHKQTTGTGELNPRLLAMRLTRLGTSRPIDGELRGVGALFNDAGRYGYDAEAEVLSLPELQWHRPGGTIRWEATLDQEAAKRLWAQLMPKTADVLQNHQWPESMAPARIARLTSPEVTT